MFIRLALQRYKTPQLIKIYTSQNFKAQELKFFVKKSYYMDASNKISRRKAIGGLGVGIAAVAATPAFGAPVSSHSLADGAPLENPVDKYPKPPFNGQSQPWPGLASLMDPRPDHGEKTYKGSGRLTGRKALITGGDSGMGRAAAIAYAREGADVVINYYPTEEPDAKEVLL
jgi:hypothetical protein